MCFPSSLLSPVYLRCFRLFFHAAWAILPSLQPVLNRLLLFSSSVIPVPSIVTHLSLHAVRRFQCGCFATESILYHEFTTSCFQFASSLLPLIFCAFQRIAMLRSSTLLVIMQSHSLQSKLYVFLFSTFRHLSLPLLCLESFFTRFLALCCLTRACIANCLLCSHPYALD